MSGKPISYIISHVLFVMIVKSVIDLATTRILLEPRSGMMLYHAAYTQGIWWALVRDFFRLPPLTGHA